MIKKTIKTLKNNPILFAWFMIPFVYQAISLFLENQGILSPIRFTEALRNISAEGWNAGAIEYFTWLIDGLYTAGWMFLLYPPLVYFIYKSADNQPITGWYVEGLKHGWWKITVFTLIAMVGIMAVGMILGLVSALLFGIFSLLSYVGSLIFMVIFVPVMIVFVVSILIYMQTGSVTVIAEEDFGKGLGMAFKVGRKHFFRIILIALLSLLPMIITAIGLRNGQQDLSDTIYLLVSFTGCIISPIVTTFIMHCYIDIRNKEIEKHAILHAVKNEE